MAKSSTNARELIPDSAMSSLQRKAIKIAAECPRTLGTAGLENNDRARQMGEIPMASLEVARLEDGSWSGIWFEPASAKATIATKLRPILKGHS